MTITAFAFDSSAVPPAPNLLPTATALSIAATATLDLNGVSQQVGRGLGGRHATNSPGT